MQKRLHSVACMAAGILSVITANGHEHDLAMKGTVAMMGTRDSSSSQRDCCAVLELRQYTLKPGQRDLSRVAVRGAGSSSTATRRRTS